MPKVLTFGTFDIIHPGHTFYLNESRKYAGEDTLITIVARDKNVQKYKKTMPQHNENYRLKKVRAMMIADVVELGEEENTFEPIRKHNPDIICLGYDQDSHGVEKQFPNIEIIRIAPYKEHIYKSSKLKTQNEENL